MSKQRKAKKSASVHADEPIANVTLVVALPEERAYFHQVVSVRPGWEAATERQRYLCHYQSAYGTVRVLVQTLTGMGHIEAVLGTSSVIASGDPDLVVMLGIAGSLRPDTVGLGDVVVSNQVKLYTGDKVAAISGDDDESERAYRFDDDARATVGNPVIVDRRDRILDRSFLRYERKFIESLTMDHVLTAAEPRLRRQAMKPLAPELTPERFRELKSMQRPNRKLHMGWILGSHLVVDSAEYRAYLVAKNTELEHDVHRQKGDHARVQWKEGELLAVDMESYGLLRAVELARATPSMQGGCPNLVGGVVVRGISDLCEEKGELDESTGAAVRRLAVENATDICLSLIEQLDYVSLADV